MIENSYYKQIKVFIFLLCIISLIIPIIQYHIKYIGYIGISGVFINDTESYWGNLTNIQNNFEFSNITLLGVLILYYPALFFGSLYCFLINFSLLVLSTSFFLKTLPFLDLKLNKTKIYLIFILILSNFYLWGILYFPNKEIPLIFLVNLLLYLYLKGNNIFFVLLVTTIIFFFRDGFSFIIFCILLGIYMFKNFIYSNPFKFVLFSIIFLTFFSLKTLSELGILNDYQYVIDRNIEYSQDVGISKSTPFYLTYFINLLNNTLGYAFRAQFFDQNLRLYFSGIGIWHFSVILFVGLVSWVYLTLTKIVNNSNFKKLISFLILAQLLLSTSSYPQTRYMMPFIYWLSTGFFLFLNFKTGSLLFIILLIISFFLILFGLSHDLPLGIDIDNFSKSFL